MAAGGDDSRWMRAALTLGERGRGRTGANPNVGCIIVEDGKIVGRGWTQPGGRPHAEAMALEQADKLAREATAYVTLEPCAHDSMRGPACADLLIETGVARVVAALTDPDTRTAGKGLARLEAAGVAVAHGAMEAEARSSMAGFLSRIEQGRPHVTLKLGMSLDGQIALADGTSQWITRKRARAHAHLERARCDAILVGGGTLRTDTPRLDVRLAGLEDRSPTRVLLTRGAAPDGWSRIAAPEEIASLDANWLLVEGGAETAAAFLAADLVDRLLIYRAPVLIGTGKAALGDIGLADLTAAHGRWRHVESRRLAPDTLAVLDRAR